MKELLKSGFHKINIPIDDSILNQLEDFYYIYEAWNKKINLSSIHTKEDFAVKHILDSATALKYFNTNKLIGDLGSGGGFPGIVLKILKPELKIALIEVTQKKINYLLELQKTLNLDLALFNPSLTKVPLFDVITCRAFGSLEKIIRESKKFLKKKNGKILAYKGKKNKILEEIKDYFRQNIKIIPLEVPYLKGERNLVSIDFE